MATTPVPPLSNIPSFPALSDRAAGTYNSKAFAFGTHMADVFVAEVNALVANLNAFAAGGAFAIPFKVDTTSIAAADPGDGLLRFNSATQNAATALYLDLAAFGGTDVTAKLDQFGASTSTVKGTLRMVQLDDLARELVFNVTALASPTGYRNVTVTPVSSTATAPFANGATVILFFDRNGDKGTQGDPGGFVHLASYTASGSVANIDFLNVFSSLYDKYTIEIQGISPSAFDTLYMRLARGGTVDGGSLYTASMVDNGAGAAASQNGAQISNSSLNYGTFTIEVCNANHATMAKLLNVRGLSVNNNASPFLATMRQVVYTNTGALSGFRLYWGGGANTGTGAVVRVFGHRNS